MVFTKAQPPPPLDLRYMTTPYVPTWDVLRRMTESNHKYNPLPKSPPIEAVLDMGSFDDNDDDFDELAELIHAERKMYEMVASCTNCSSTRLWVCAFSFFLVLLLLAAFRVDVPVVPFKFVRERV